VILLFLGQLIEEIAQFLGFGKAGISRILLDADLDVEQMQVVEIDLDDVFEFRKSVPYLKDRRIDTYKPIC